MCHPPVSFVNELNLSASAKITGRTHRYVEICPVRYSCPEWNPIWVPNMSTEVTKEVRSAMTWVIAGILEFTHVPAEDEVEQLVVHSDHLWRNVIKTCA